jgi:hypothetical protein
MNQIARALRWLATVVITALVAGVVGGLVARLAMRVVALTDDEPGTLFTVGGTLGIVVVAVVLNAVATALYSPIAINLSGSDVKKGLVLGAVLIVIPGLIVLGEAIDVGRPLFNVPMFAGVAVLDGLVIAVTFGRLHRALPAPRSDQPDSSDDPSSSPIATANPGSSEVVRMSPDSSIEGTE